MSTNAKSSLIDRLKKCKHEITKAKTSLANFTQQHTFPILFAGILISGAIGGGGAVYRAGTQSHATVAQVRNEITQQLKDDPQHATKAIVVRRNGQFCTTIYDSEETTLCTGMGNLSRQAPHP